MGRHRRGSPCSSTSTWHDRGEPEGPDGGYSDITNLHVALLRDAGLATFHGPGFGSMGAPERTAYTWDSVLEAFAKGGTGPVPPDPDDPYRRTIAPGRSRRPSSAATSGR